MRKRLKFLVFPIVVCLSISMFGLFKEFDVLAAVTKNWTVNGQYSLFNAGLGGPDVGITQGLKGSTSTMELTTSDAGGNQATRVLVGGKTNTPSFELYSGPRGSELLKFIVDGSGNVKWGSNRGRLRVDQGASIELGGKGTPYIDFSNDATTDYDARLILTGNDSLNIAGTNVGINNNSPIAKLDVNGDIATRNSGAVASNNSNMGGVNLSWIGDQARIRIGGDGPGAKNGLAIQEVGNATILRIDETSGTVKLTSDYPTLCIGKC